MPNSEGISPPSRSWSHIATDDRIAADARNRPFGRGLALATAEWAASFAVSMWPSPSPVQRSTAQRDRERQRFIALAGVAHAPGQRAVRAVDDIVERLAQRFARAARGGLCDSAAPSLAASASMSSTVLGASG